MKNFLTKQDIPIKPPIQVRIFRDYNKLDRLANKRGYLQVEPSLDSKPDLNIYPVGLQQSSLHSGWIATWGDNSHNPGKQIELLNEKIQTCIENKENVIIGFCQTGNFSIGYSIYVKIKE